MPKEANYDLALQILQISVHSTQKLLSASETKESQALDLKRKRTEEEEEKRNQKDFIKLVYYYYLGQSIRNAFV